MDQNFKTEIGFNGANTLFANTTSAWTSVNTFAIGTAATVVANGNFGIGTSAPNTVLDVNGNATFRLNAYVNNGIFFSNNASAALYFDDGVGGHPYFAQQQNDKNFVFNSSYANGSARGVWSIYSANNQSNFTLYVNTYINASLGIGITTPAKALDVASDVWLRANVIFGTNQHKLYDAGGNAAAIAISSANNVTNYVSFTANSSVSSIGTFNSTKLAFAPNQTELGRFDPSTGGFYVGSTGGDIGATWTGIFRKNQDDYTRVGILNGTQSSGAAAELYMATGTTNSYLQFALYDKNGLPQIYMTAGTNVQNQIFQANGTWYFQNLSGSTGMAVSAEGVDLYAGTTIHGNLYDGNGSMPGGGQVLTNWGGNVYWDSPIGAIGANQIGTFGFMYCTYPDTFGPGTDLSGAYLQFCALQPASGAIEGSGTFGAGNWQLCGFHDYNNNYSISLWQRYA